jgi:hypothetical protein
VVQNVTENRDSSVSTVIRLRDGRSGFDVGQGQVFFLFATASRPVLGPTQPPIEWVLGVKQSGREVHHLSPSNAEVTNMWSCAFTPPILLLAWYLVKHRDIFVPSPIQDTTYI